MSRTPQSDSRWLAAWRNASARIDRLREEELAGTDTAFVIEALDEAFESARRWMEPSKTSGLVAQQAWFMRAQQ